MHMSTVASTTVTGDRPATITLATIIAIVTQVLSVPYFLLAPGAGDIPTGAVVVMIVAGVVTIGAAWAMLQLQRWGAIVVFTLTLINGLTAVPGLFNAPSGWILAGLIGSLPLVVAVLLLIAMPSSRRALRQKQ